MINSCLPDPKQNVWRATTKICGKILLKNRDDNIKYALQIKSYIKFFNDFSPLKVLFAFNLQFTKAYTFDYM